LGIVSMINRNGLDSAYDGGERAQGQGEGSAAD
jgi:hypothetical protein